MRLNAQTLRNWFFDIQWNGEKRYIGRKTCYEVIDCIINKRWQERKWILGKAYLMMNLLCWNVCKKVNGYFRKVAIKPLKQWPYCSHICAIQCIACFHILMLYIYISGHGHYSEIFLRFSSHSFCLNLFNFSIDVTI